MRNRILCYVLSGDLSIFVINLTPDQWLMFLQGPTFFIRKLRLDTPTHALESELCSRVNNNNLSISTTEKTNESPASERDSNPSLHCFYGCKFSRAPFWISESVLLYVRWIWNWSERNEKRKADTSNNYSAEIWPKYWTSGHFHWHNYDDWITRNRCFTSSCEQTRDKGRIKGEKGNWKGISHLFSVSHVFGLQIIVRSFIFGDKKRGTYAWKLQGVTGV